MGNNFSWALTKLAQGIRVYRISWDANEWIGLSTFSGGPSLPAAGGGGISLPFIFMNLADNNTTPWTPTQEDLLAQDWYFASFYDRTAVVTPSIGVSKLALGLTLVDGDLMYSNSVDGQNKVRNYIKNSFETLGVFVEGFGPGKTLGGWKITDPMPEPNMASLDEQLKNKALLGVQDLHIYLYRYPSQFRGVTKNGVTTLMTESQTDYNSDGARLLTDQIPNFILWVRRVAKHLMSAYGARIFKIGSEMKGFQGRARDNLGQKWDFDDYAGTPGRADMGYHTFYKHAVAGITAAAQDLGIDLNEIQIGGPYAVTASQGEVVVGGKSDAVLFDVKNDSQGQPVSYSALNNRYWGFVNKAPLEAIDEFLRLCKLHNTKLDFLSVDFGTYNTDGAITKDDDFGNAYDRYKDHFTWYKERLLARGYENLPIDVAEWYTKPQYPLDDQTNFPTHYLADQSLLPKYYAALKAMSLIAMFEQGVRSPCIWSPYGRGDGTTVGTVEGFDSAKWYGGMVRRPPDGGEARPFLNVCLGINNFFKAPTNLYSVNSSSPSKFKAIANDSYVMIVNKTAETLAVIIESNLASLQPYEVAIYGRILGGSNEVYG